MSFYINTYDRCFKCNNLIKDYNYDISVCGHSFHTKCWKGTCSPCEKQKKLQKERISQENWSTVAGTAIISVVVYALLSLSKR